MHDRISSVDEGVLVVLGRLAPGELTVLHPFGYDGYLNEAGEWILQADPAAWYRTGDIAKADADGAIKVLGRAGASLNRDGYLVLLEDIERIVEKLPGIQQVVVTPAPGTDARGDRIAAFCVPKDGAALDGQDIRAKCFDILPRYALPDEVHVMDTLPLLASGKVDRRALAAQLQPTEQ